MGKKSPSLKPPKPDVLPRGIGPVVEPNRNDVLCGRGGRVTAHPGNVQMRELAIDVRYDYVAETTKKLEKVHIVARVVRQIRNMDPPGRFLKQDADTDLWWDIGDVKARTKVAQVLRECPPYEDMILYTADVLERVAVANAEKQAAGALLMIADSNKPPHNCE